MQYKHTYLNKNYFNINNNDRQNHKLSSKINVKNIESDNFKHKKSLGQNFLHDEVILDRIIQSIPFEICGNIESNIRLIEIGIGLGDLTKRLLDKYELLAYEIDSNLIQHAKQIFKDELALKKLVLVQQDVLKISNKDGYLFNGDYFLVSNLPYYIATAIILRVLKDKYCKGFLVMTQKEVAQKFCAIHGDSSFCALSVLAQSFGDIKYLFNVSKESFIPQPQVQSAVFCFQRKDSFYTKELETLLHYAFIAPRKKLFTNLMQYDMIYNKDMLIDIFNYLGLSRDIRAHEVCMQDYCNMVQYINLHKG